MGIDLDYNPAVSSALIAEMETWARKLGVSLDDLELMGQETRTARGFVRAAENGRHAAFLERLDRDRLQGALRARRTAHDATVFQGAAAHLPGLLPVA